MTTLVLGASGATGKQLVAQLLDMGQKVKVIVRPTSLIPEIWEHHPNLNVLRIAEQTQLSAAELALLLKDCDAVASCLGHNLSFKGMYGQPRMVTQMIQLLCAAILKNASEEPIKLVLMNTAGNSNRDLNEKISFAQQLVIAVLRLLVPPHPDNEQAADYLRLSIGQTNPWIEWVVVRPDSLIDLAEVTAYSAHASPTTSALFGAGQTSRINVAHFMAQLILDDQIWQQWKGQMPVVYNS